MYVPEFLKSHEDDNIHTYSIYMCELSMPNKLSLYIMF